MPLHFRSTAAKRTRPPGPSCRGGASSLLRLAQPAAGSPGGWLARAAAMAMSSQRFERDVAGTREFASSIITPLLPSATPARR